MIEKERGKAKTTNIYKKRMQTRSKRNKKKTVAKIINKQKIKVYNDKKYNNNKLFT